MPFVLLQLLLIAILLLDALTPEWTAALPLGLATNLIYNLSMDNCKSFCTKFFIFLVFFAKIRLFYGFHPKNFVGATLCSKQLFGP